MKQLQNDFTTPEQSKLLLELGVPADSADFSMTENGKNVEMLDGILYSEFIKRVPQNYSRTRFLPCWSVGRLIEVIKVCCTDDNVKDEIATEVMYSNKNSAQLIIEMMSEYANVMDFSKLED